MSSTEQSKNVTVTATKKQVTTVDADGWTSVKKVTRQPKKEFKKNSNKGAKKVVKNDEPKKDEVVEAASEKPVETTVDAKTPKVYSIPITMTTPSNGKGYLSAIMKGTVMDAPMKKAADSDSVVSDSSTESSHPPTPRRLSFSEEKKTNVGKTKPSNPGKTFYKPSGPRPKRTEEENKAHQAYISALRKAENDFLKECLPTDKERISKTSFELSKIRNYSSTVHEVSFAKDFDDVEVSGKNVSFSRAKFARNKFFINRLRDEYMKMYPSADWVSVRESTRADKPDTLYVRVGNRE
jgi:hypothetical protein